MRGFAGPCSTGSTTERATPSCQRQASTRLPIVPTHRKFPCAKGEQRVACFAEAGESCIVTTYRGTGPPRGRVDATPALMKEWCDKPSLPAAVTTECARIKANAESLAARINCFAEPTHDKCKSRMDAVETAKTADAPE